MFSTIWATHVLAQTGATPWSTPINVSQSGAASLPTLAAAPDGTLHLLWWDKVEGEQYVHTTSISPTVWTRPASIPSILGSRRLNADTGRETISAPSETRLIADARGGIQALWLDSQNQLLSIRSDGTSWAKESTGLADEAVMLDVQPGISNTFHLVYVRPTNAPDAPSGIYYRNSTGADWSEAKLVYGSPYFRAIKPGDIYISVTGDDSGHAIVAWDDPQTSQSVYAVTNDGGAQWSAPQAVSGATSGNAQHARLASTPNGTWLLVWQDNRAGGCGFLQRQSSDGGQTWSSPEKILSTLTRCTEQWDFSHSADGRLWMMSHPATFEQNTATNVTTVATWDGTRWSEPVDVTLSSYDAATGHSNNLNCIGVAVAGSTAGVVGCDPSGDIWAARNAVALQDFITAAKPVWDPIEVLSQQSGSSPTADLPAVVADDQGNVYAIWSQPTSSGDNETALYGSMRTNNRWSRSALLLHSPDSTNAQRIAVQPLLALDARGKIHAIWSSGIDGPLNYSWVHARDFSGSANWAEPIVLPATTRAGSWPSMAVDATGTTIYVMYAKPFNEGRGIYLARSLDGGATWTEPILVFDAAAAKWESIDKPQIVLDEQSNTLHASWLQATVPGSTSAQAIYYAQSTDQGQTWSSPAKMAEGAVNWPQLSLIGPGQIYLTWVQSNPRAPADSSTPYSVMGNYSLDGGRRWSPAEAVPGFQQVSGPARLNSDRAGHLYMTAVGTRAGGESALLFSHWTGQSWSDRDLIGLGAPAMMGNAATIANAPVAGRLDAILRAWQFGQDNQGQFEIAATGRNVEAAVITPAPTFTPMPTMTPGPTATPLPTATPRPQLTDAEQQPAKSTQGSPPLLLAGLLAAIVVIIIAGGSIIARRNR